MNKKIYVNLPVQDINKSTAFYEALGFVKNPQFSNNDGVALMWSDSIVLMILTYDFYQKFLNGKKIGHPSTDSLTLLALEMPSREEVDTFARIAKENGGSYFMAEPNKGLDFMYGLEVQDLDGHTWEPFYMDISKFPPQSEQK